jgi:hypothetical protein
VIDAPTTDLVNEVIGIGNCSGAQVDKFTRQDLGGAQIQMNYRKGQLVCVRNVTVTFTI